jgi:putative ABC transport system permease protein
VLRVTWRNLVARKWRLFLSAFSIILGVAFVAGTLIFTNALSGAFDKIVEGSVGDVEVAYEGARAFEAQDDNRTIPASVVTDLEALPEVAEAWPEIALQTFFLIGADGKVVGGNGPPGLAFINTEAENVKGDPILTLVEGTWPQAPDEVTIDEAALEKSGYDVGEMATFASPGDPPTVELTIVGVSRFAAATNGATIATLDKQFMQDLLFGGQDVYNGITLQAAPGVTQDELALAAQAVLPEGVEAVTGDATIADAKETLDSVFGTIETFLLVFAVIALFVGSFIIFNTFSMLVGQRSRELALLRAMGASRRQITGAVVLEAVAVGLVGATAGLGLGFLLALALRALFGAFGLDLSGADFVLTAQAVIACYVLGVVVTVIASLGPARRAGRIPVVVAMTGDAVTDQRALTRRYAIGTLLLVGGLVAVLVSVQGEGSSSVLTALGVGVMASIVGTYLISPVLGRPLITVFGVLYRRLFGGLGNLATENSLRDPRRTAATASALMIGVALMTMGSVFASSFSATQQNAIRQAVTSQFVISNAQGIPFSASVASRSQDVPGVSVAVSIRQDFPKVDEDRAPVVAIDPPSALAEVLDTALFGDLLADLGPGTAVVTQGFASDRGLALGDTIDIEFQAGDVTVEIVGILPVSEGIANSVLGQVLVSPETFAAGGLAPASSLVYIAKDPAADTDEVRDGLEEIVADLPLVTVKDPEQLVAQVEEQGQQFIAIIYLLLGLSVAIAMLGVVNTLSLSVIERTREIGLLRAVGLTRRQTRRMITLESIVLAVFGAALGVLLGAAFGATLVRALESQGLDTLAIPWVTIIVFLVIAALLGVLAAFFPGRRAAKLDVLRAIATE